MMEFVSKMMGYVLKMTAKRGRENAEAMRRIGQADVIQRIESWGMMDEATLKATASGLVKSLNKMLRKFPWQVSFCVKNDGFCT